MYTRDADTNTLILQLIILFYRKHKYLVGYPVNDYEIKADYAKT